MALFRRGIVEEIGAAREAEAAHAGEVAQTLRLIARLAHQVTPGDLALVDDEVQRALMELGESYGFTRLAAAARDTRLDERAVM